jgi:hypothetical protein
MRVNEGYDSAWEYHPNSISVGSLYLDKQRLQDAITSRAMSTQRVFKTVASNKKYLTVECMKERCPGRVHGDACGMVNVHRPVGNPKRKV